MGLLGDVGGIVGGAFGLDQSDDHFDAARNDRREEAYTEYLRQKEFAQSGIQWRVQDARQAGLHPVFALSGGGAAYSPQAVSVGDRGVSVSDYASMGQNVGRALQATLSDDQKYVAELQNSLLRAQIDETRSRAELNRSQIPGQGGSNRFGVSQVPPSFPSTVDFSPDVGRTVPSERISSSLEDASVAAAASSPALERFTVRDADDRMTDIYLPSTGGGQASQALESVSENYGLLYSIAMDNLKRDPALIYKMRHLWPGGEMAADVARWLERKMQQALNWKKGRAAAHEMAKENMRRWNRSGRERGVNWR